MPWGASLTPSKSRAIGLFFHTDIDFSLSLIQNLYLTLSYTLPVQYERVYLYNGYTLALYTLTWVIPLILKARCLSTMQSNQGKLIG
jgi:hypothetical protein